VTLEGDDDPFTDEERRSSAVRRPDLRAVLEAVGSSRKMTRDEVHPIAAGRVWTAASAGAKVVDELGGLETR